MVATKDGDVGELHGHKTWIACHALVDFKVIIIACGMPQGDGVLLSVDGILIQVGTYRSLPVGVLIPVGVEEARGGVDS